MTALIDLPLIYPEHNYDNKRRTYDRHLQQRNFLTEYKYVSWAALVNTFIWAFIYTYQ